MEKNANPNGGTYARRLAPPWTFLLTANAARVGTSKMTPNEILAAQKAWRMQKRRELEARNKKKQARQQIVDTNYNAAVVAQHAAPPPAQNTAQTVVPPIKRFKANYHAENPQLAAPVENNSGVVYSVSSFPASQPGTYQHYEYVGAPQTLLSNPTSTAPLPTDEQSRTAEAQRAWKEQKLREIAEKKAKGTPSKRGRRKMASVPTDGVDEETLLATRSDGSIVTSMAATMAMTSNSMPISATHSVPLTSHSMPLTSHGLVQAQQSQEADSATGQTAAELVAMANQTIAPSPLEQYTFMSTTEHKVDHQVEQPQSVDTHQQVVGNVAEHDQQQMVETVGEHHQQVVETVTEVHQPQMENVAEHHQQQMETVGEHHNQEQMPAVESHQQQIEQSLEVQHPQQVENVEQHAQHAQHGPAVTVAVHPEAVGNVEAHAQATGNVEVTDEQGATVEAHQVDTENVAAHEHQGETVMVSHHQAQVVEDVKNVQEAKAEALDANGVAADNGGGAYADTTTAGDAFQIDGSEDIMGAASAWHDGLGNMNQ